MRSEIISVELRMRATDALKAILGQVSGVKVKEMRREVQATGRSVEIIADTDVFGHTHLLACGVKVDAEPDQLREALRILRDDAASLGNATPVIIAPYLSPEAQQLCKDNNAGYLDLQGNARLTLGEVFIRTRSLPSHAANQAAALRARPVRSAYPRTSARTYSSDQVAIPLGA